MKLYRHMFFIHYTGNENSMELYRHMFCIHFTVSENSMELYRHMFFIHFTVSENSMELYRQSSSFALLGMKIAWNCTGTCSSFTLL